MEIEIRDKNIKDYMIMELDISDYFNKLNLIEGDGIIHYEENKGSSTGFSRDIGENLEILNSNTFSVKFINAVCTPSLSDAELSLSDSTLAYALKLLGKKTILVTVLKSHFLELEKVIEYKKLDLKLCALSLDSL